MLRSVRCERPWRARLAALTSVERDERRLAGVVNGTFWALGGLTVAAFTVLPGVSHAHLWRMVAIAVATIAIGVGLTLRVDWDRAPSWLLHLCTASGLVVIALVIAGSGGARSPAWAYLFFVGLYSAYFFQRAVAIAYIVACVLTHSLVGLYDARAAHEAFLAQWLVAAGGYIVLGGAIVAGKERLARLRARAEELANEQSSLRRVATAVVVGRTPEQIYALVAYEMAALLGGGAAGILRLDTTPAQATVMGSWADHPGGRYPPGTTVPIRPGSDLELALATNGPVRIDVHPDDSPVKLLGYEASIVAPVHVSGCTWGVLAVTARLGTRLTVADELRLTAFGDLLATAIGAIEDRAKLAAQASSDPLTGLANHRTLQQRLADQVATAAREGRPLSVVVLDIDHFKQINDTGGHESGDEILLLVARCLEEIARGRDTLGRAGGDEFTWILPDTTADEALVASESVRRLIAARAPDPTLVTVSAGICDTGATLDPAELIHLADGALYWSKAHGRNQCRIYDPAVVNELSAEERAERLERSRALVGLRSLATAIDAKDPATREHSDRVATIAGQLARTAGWPAERARQLSEAALVHDVGKIGVPDAVLRKATPLTLEERRQIEGHAELAARIVEGVLSPEQVEWIRTHHERPDGDGYPRGLCGAEIPEGAALLAVADAWDVMTVSRPYSLEKTIEESLEECLALVGRQFSEAAVAALVALYDSGALAGEALATAQPLLASAF
jgi:diguanylate cyclase (GGDEF)-like protein